MWAKISDYDGAYGKLSLVLYHSTYDFNNLLILFSYAYSYLEFWNYRKIALIYNGHRDMVLAKGDENHDY